MALSVEMVTEEALKLPASGRASVVETLLASLSSEAEIDPAITRAHLDEVRNRREAASAGRATLVDISEVFAAARAASEQK